MNAVCQSKQFLPYLEDWHYTVFPSHSLALLYTKLSKYQVIKREGELDIKQKVGKHWWKKKQEWDMKNKNWKEARNSLMKNKMSGRGMCLAYSSLTQTLMVWHYVWEEKDNEFSVWWSENVYDDVCAQDLCMLA